MDFNKILTLAGVPSSEHADAIKCLEMAKADSSGLTWHKWNVRLFKARKISQLIHWEAERLIDVRPDLASWDIAPMINITAHGDNAYWVMTPEGGRPVPGRWLNTDPQSEDYQAAVKSNYWCVGEHPRSKKSVEAWYRRNGAEYEAWRRGSPVGAAHTVKKWESFKWESSKSHPHLEICVYNSEDAWQVLIEKRVLGNLYLDYRLGYEIDNTITPQFERAWYPIHGHQLRAPVVWSIVPRIKKS